MRLLLKFVLLFMPALFFSQNNAAKTYDGNEKSEVIYENLCSKSGRYNRTIDQINLQTDTEFEFRSIPYVSCITWKEFNGTYKIQNDTIIFKDKFTLANPDMEFKSKTDNNLNSFIFNFGYDNKQKIDGREIKISLIYDFDSKIKDVERLYQINSKYSIELPFSEVPNRDKLASFKIELNPNTSRKIWNYFTTNEFANKKKNELPNIINITFVANPKKEEIIRITKGIIDKNNIIIISSNSESNLKNYSDLLLFKQSYKRTYYE